MLSSTGDPVKGANDWATYCAVCHGTPGTGYISDGLNKINALTVTEAYDAEGGFNGYEGLQYYIYHEMPKNGDNWQQCVDDCAEDVAEYIRSWVPDQTAACENDDALMYGKRGFVLLDSIEYQRSVEDLLGISDSYGVNIANNDGRVGGFPNMSDRALSGQVGELYQSNAAQIAEWAIANNQPFTCADASACATKFVDEFAYLAFRRTLTSEEKTEYIDIFTEYGAQTGMRVALEAVFSSPQFLYRSEAGVSIADALNAGYYSYNPANDTSDYVSDGNKTIVSAVDFDLATAGGAEGQADDDGKLGYNIWSNGSISHTFSQSFYDVTILEIEAKGTPFDMNWPDMIVSVGGNIIDTVPVVGNEYQVFEFVIDNQGGQTPTLEIIFDGDQGRSPYDYGNDKNLIIHEARISRGVASSATEPTVNPLTLADSDAFVLTPFEFASVLSYMYTGSTPDKTLLDAAADDRLTTPEQIEAQIARLIETDRGREHMGAFAGIWLGTDAVTSETRDVNAFTSDVKRAMAQEVRELFKHVFYDDNVPFNEFYSADYTFVNSALAEYYGFSGAFSDAFIKTNTSERGGIITTGAFMTVNAHEERTSPIQRAVRVRELMLCHHIDPPNAALDSDREAAQMRVEDFEQQNGGISSRQFYELYTEDVACDGCHLEIINPLFGMEDFDNVGRLRPGAGSGTVNETLSNGKVVEVSLAGTLIGVETVKDGQILNFTGAKDLSTKIASTTAIQSCLIRKGFRYLTGLPSSQEDLDSEVREELTPDQEQDFGCATDVMRTTLTDSNESPKAMFSKLGTLDLIRFRK